MVVCRPQVKVRNLHGIGIECKNYSYSLNVRQKRIKRTVERNQHKAMATWTSYQRKRVILKELCHEIQPNWEITKCPLN